MGEDGGRVSFAGIEETLHHIWVVADIVIDCNDGGIWEGA